jgi:hypothetical protein
LGTASQRQSAKLDPIGRSYSARVEDDNDDDDVVTTSKGPNGVSSASAGLKKEETNVAVLVHVAFKNELLE